MDHFAALGSTAFKVHMEMRSLYYLLLPIFFMASIGLVWLQNPMGSPEFVDKVKRAFVGTLLLVGFTEITDVMLFLTNGIADKIDTMSGLDAIMQMASEKANSYTSSSMTPILAIDDLLMSVLSYLSYAVLYFARFIMVAIYHFAWVFLTMMAPLLLLLHVFTSQVTINLFKSMFEIATWKVAWSLLSVMLKALPFGTWYAMEGNYLTIIVLNFVIAICMMGTPILVHSLLSGSFTSFVGGLGGVTGAVMLATPAKLGALATMGSKELGLMTGMMKNANAKIGQSGASFPSPRMQSTMPPPMNPPPTPPPPRPR